MKMKLKTYFSAVLLCLAVGLFAGCSSDSPASGNLFVDNKNGKQPTEEVKGVHFSIDEPKLTTSSRALIYGGNTANAKTRTFIKHTIGNGADAYWSNNDFIFVKDKYGNWQKSIATTLHDGGSSAEFILPGAVSDYLDGCEVRYMGSSAVSATEVKISGSQIQSVGNNFEHAGAAGDCGVGTARATGNPIKFNFTLSHQNSYLCLLPRSSNAIVQRSKLIRIEISSDDDIAGNYNFAADGSLQLVSGGTKTITVTTDNGGNGFELNNPATNLDKNATYVVLAPGTHNLMVRYWLRNTTDYPDPVGKIEGTITKYVTVNSVPGKIDDITANLEPIMTYNNWVHYMWNAAYPYWEWGTPAYVPSNSASGVHGSNYPTTSADARWYGKGTSSNGTPNVNEMMWYGRDGDWYSDTNELFVWQNHLWRGIWWVLRRVNIPSMNPNLAPDGHNRLTEALPGSIHYSISHVGIRPPKNQLSKYFMIPGIGYYDDGIYHKNSATYGYRHTSSLVPGWGSDYSYYLDFYPDGLFIGMTSNRTGAVEQGFE